MNPVATAFPLCFCLTFLALPLQKGLSRVRSEEYESVCNAEDPGSVAGLARFHRRRKWLPTPAPGNTNAVHSGEGVQALVARVLGWKEGVIDAQTVEIRASAPTRHT